MPVVIDNLIKTRFMTLNSGKVPWQRGTFSGYYFIEGRKLPFIIYRIYFQKPSQLGHYQVTLYYGLEDNILAEVQWSPQLEMQADNPEMIYSVPITTLPILGKGVRAKLQGDKGGAKVQAALGYILWRRDRY
jgi:hypothetical protein